MPSHSKSFLDFLPKQSLFFFELPDFLHFMTRLGIVLPSVRNVTGTIVMMDDEIRSDATTTDSLKKTDTGIILHPQPHDDPNDPLNWPVIRKDLCFLIIGCQTFIGGGQTAILAAGFSGLKEEFHKTLSTISYLVGAFMLSLGVGSVLASPTAVLYGKRLVYICGISLFLVGAIVAGASKTYGALMAGRLLTGIGASPTESLASASLSELYFQHERAYRTGLYTLLLLGGKNLVPLLSSLVFQHLDRHWLYWIIAILLGTNLVLTFLFVPETFWDRSPTPSKRSIAETEAARHVQGYIPPEKRPHAYALPSTNNVLDVQSLNSSMLGTTQSRTHPVALTGDDPATDNDHASVASEPKSFKNRLALYSGRHTLDKWWMVALRPFYLYLYPSVLYGSFVYSFGVVWLIVISETISEIFKGHGYGYSQQAVGLFYLGPFIGGVLGSLSTGLLGDNLVRFMVKKNHGVYEPEFRLLMLIPSSFFICFGLFGYGWSTQELSPWIAPVVFFGCLSYGSSMACTSAITYVVDSYKMFASESLVSFNFMKNFLGFIISLFNTDVLESIGSKKLFIIYGCIQIALSIGGVVTYRYGKLARAWTDEKEILRSLYVPNSPLHPSKAKEAREAKEAKDNAEARARESDQTRHQEGESSEFVSADTTTSDDSTSKGKTEEHKSESQSTPETK